MKRTYSFLTALLFILIFTFAGAESITEDMSEPEVTEEIILDIPDSDIPDSGNPEEDPAAEYIHNVMPHRPRFLISRPSGYRLLEPALSLYIALREAAREVADGEQTNTEFAIPYDGLIKNTFTEEELETELVTEDGKINPDAKTAAKAALNLQLKSAKAVDAVSCLITDAAYELYWFNKSKGHGAKISYTVTGYSVSKTDSTITVKGNIVVRMSVSQDYAVVTVNGNGETEYEEYTVNDAYGKGVQAAAENARAIINANAGKSDEEKLAAYRDAICALADYNDDVVEGDPYGDPWQIVWVFDGKPSTDVVCEGFSRAFQYLCELGTTEATAICVQGQSGGAHMWNIVSFYGHNYLVDITGCDAGLDLFMKGCADGSATGYTIRHRTGTKKYTYNENLDWTEEDLTLYPMDYSEWKEIVETVPEIQMSSDALYDGYAAAARPVHDETGFMPTALVIYRTGEEAEATRFELAATGGIGMIPEPGGYYFTVIRDGKESLPTEAVSLSMAEMPEGPEFRLPAGAEIEAEAFAGDESITRIEAEDCTIRAGAFTGSGVVTARLEGTCTVEDGAFEDTTVLCLDAGSEWTEGYRFLIAIPETQGSEN